MRRKKLPTRKRKFVVFFFFSSDTFFLSGLVVCVRIFLPSAPLKRGSDLSLLHLSSPTLLVQESCVSRRKKVDAMPCVLSFSCGRRWGGGEMGEGL